MLDVEAIRARLGEATLGGEIRALGSVTSTSDIAWAWADAGCPEGTAVFADEQVRGRGRFGRTWLCPRGKGLLASVVFRPPEGVGPAHLTAIGAVAAAEAADHATGLPAAIRWPNDVTLRGRKVAGVLVETRGGSGPSPCVLGLGMNVNVAPEEFPQALRDSATSLAAETGRAVALEEVAAAVLRALDLRYRAAVEGRWAEVAACWAQRNSLVGQMAEVADGGRALRGRVVEADPLAGLTLELAGGERHLCRPESASLVLPPLAEPRAEGWCPCSTR